MNFETTETIEVAPGSVPSNETDQTVVYSLSPESVSFANVTIDPASGEVSITSVTDQIGTQQFVITADDGEPENNTAQASFTLTVTDTNIAPVIMDQSFEIGENSTNGTVIGTVIASDSNMDAITFSITEGNGSDVFVLNETSGELTVNLSLIHI